MRAPRACGACELTRAPGGFLSLSLAQAGDWYDPAASGGTWALEGNEGGQHVRTYAPRDVEGRRGRRCSGARCEPARWSGARARPARGRTERHRARRHPDPGEPLVRPLLRDASGRPWLRRQNGPAEHLRTAGLPRGRATGACCCRSTRHRRRATRRAVLPRHHTLVGAPARKLERRRDGRLRESAPRLRRARSRSRDDGLLRARGHSLLLRVGRKLHRLRQLPLLGLVRPTRTACTR